MQMISLRFSLIKVAAFFTVMLSAGCAQKVEGGKYEILIPQRYQSGVNAPFIQTRDNSPYDKGVNFVIPEHEIKSFFMKNKETYYFSSSSINGHEIMSHIEPGVLALSDTQLSLIRRAIDIKGAISNNNIITDKKYYKISYPGIIGKYYIIDFSKESNNLIKMIAICDILKSEINICYREIGFDGFKLRYYTNIENLGRISLIDRFYQLMIRSWKAKI